jgi:hypothetical protein
MDMISLAENLLCIGGLAIATGIFLAVRQYIDYFRSSTEEYPLEPVPDFSEIDVDYDILDQPARSILELEFFARLSNLPDEYAGFILPELGNHFRVPATNNAVGDLQVDVASRFYRVRVGTHTDEMFQNPHKAADFISDILNDNLVFRITPELIELYSIDEFNSPDEVDKDYYLWSGPLLPKLLFRDTEI